MPRVAESRWTLPLLSAALMYVAYRHPFLVPSFVALVPLLAWLDANLGRGVRAHLGAGFLFGVATYTVSLHWVHAMADYSPLAWVLYGILVLVFSLGTAAVVAAAGHLRRWTGGGFGWILPAAWLPFEWIRTFGDLRMTVDHVSHQMAKYPFFVQFADLLGPWGVGAATLAINGLLYEMFAGVRSRARAGLALCALLVAVLGYDLWAWNRYAGPAERTIRAAVVQPNVPLEVKWDDTTRAERVRSLIRMTMEAAESGPDLVVWPESALPDPVYHWLDRPETFMAPVPELLARRLEVSMLVGAEYYRVRSSDDFEYYNAALAIDPDGRLQPDWTAKVYLVPFTERTPFRKWLGPLLEGREGEVQWMAGAFSAPPEPRLLEFPQARVGVLVCYEEFFWDLARRFRNDGAEIQAVITNDAWFGRTFFQRYMVDALRLRAIENRTAFVRAANTGISGFVDPRGRYLEESPLFEPAVLHGDLPLAGERTVYDRLGDWVAWVAVAGLLAGLLAAESVRRRTPQVVAGLEAREDGSAERRPEDGLLR